MYRRNSRRTSSKCVGIDSCKRTGKYFGWSVFWIDDNDSYGFGVYPTIAGIVADHNDAGCLLIDIPVGLPESFEENEVRPDPVLRSRLKGKSSSVFNTPCRQAVYCTDKQQAKAVNLEVVKKSLSEQSLGFSKKIHEVDLFLQANPEYIGFVRESHPEYAFALLNGGKPLLSKKTEDSGLTERRALLSRYFPAADNVLSEVVAQYPKHIIDDFVDAMVLAVMGGLGQQFGFATIPDEPVKDSRGIPMEIVYVPLP